MNSPTWSVKKIRADLNETGVSVSSLTVSGRSAQIFDLKTGTSARKPRLTQPMKNKRLQYALQQKGWTCAHGLKFYFRLNLNSNSFFARKRNVCRSSAARYDEKYTQQTIKHQPSVMVLGAILIKGTTILFFLNQEPR